MTSKANTRGELQRSTKNTINMTIKDPTDKNGINIESKEEFPDLKAEQITRGQPTVSVPREDLKRSTRAANESHPNSKIKNPEDRIGKKIEIIKELKLNGPEDTFKYKNDDEILVFHFVSEKRVECPRCGKAFKTS